MLAYWQAGVHQAKLQYCEVALTHLAETVV
jgi:hypothetical protein